MKRVIVLLVAVVAINGAMAQGCLPEGITFTTQEQIDNFQTNYPGCTEIEGEVKISGTDIANLDGLDVLTSIEGVLNITNNSSLTSLSGLESLSSIGDDFYIGGNDILTNLFGLENLTLIEGVFTVNSNNALNSLSGLESLVSTGGWLAITGNNALTSLSGLESLTSIEGNLSIMDNNVLTSLIGIENIDANSIEEVYIQYNNQLNECHVQSICDYLASPNGEIYIYDNALGCNSVDEVKETCPNDVEELKYKKEIFITPNPSNEDITISSLVIYGNTQLSIINVNGDKVIKRQLTINETQIDISTLPQGVYFVRVQNEKMVEVGKMVKE